MPKIGNYKYLIIIMSEFDDEPNEPEVGNPPTIGDDDDTDTAADTTLMDDLDLL